MTKRKVGKYVPAIVGGLVLFGLACYNARVNSNFWEASFSTCLTIGVALLLSYTLTQKRSDDRRKKEIVEEIMVSLQDAVSDPKSYSMNGCTTIETLNMQKRDMSNKIQRIKKYDEKLNLGIKLNDIEKWFDEYQQFIGVHISDIDYLSKSSVELKRPLQLIADALYELRLDLYE